MPTLVRLLTTLAVIVGSVVFIMAALVYLVEPRRHPVVVDLPLDRLRSPPAPGEPMAPTRQ